MPISQDCSYHSITIFLVLVLVNPYGFSFSFSSLAKLFFVLTKRVLVLVLVN